MEAGNGTGQVRDVWHTMTTLSYEPVYKWINSMGVVTYPPA